MKLKKRAKAPISIEVIEQLKGGCHLAYKKVYIQWRRPLHTFLSTLIGNTQDAEDIVQDTFTKLWENREKIIPQKGVKAILYTVARNSAMQLFRDRRVQQDFENKSYHSDSDIDLNTSYDIIVQEETELLAEVILSRMSPQQQEIFKMSTDKGMSAKEIAKALGIKRETVYQQLSRAKSEMTKILSILLLFLIS